MGTASETLEYYGGFHISDQCFWGMTVISYELEKGICTFERIIHGSYKIPITDNNLRKLHDSKKAKVVIDVLEQPHIFYDNNGMAMVIVMPFVIIYSVL